MPSAVNKPWIDLRDILDKSGLVLCSVGLAQNFLLLYLILKRTGPKLKSYQKILLQNCIVDIIYNVAYIITRTHSDCKDGNFFLIMTDAYGLLSPPISNFLIAFLIFALFYCVTSLPVQFIYRYFLIVKDIKLNGKQYVTMIFASVLIALGYATGIFWFLWQPPSIHQEKAKLLYSDSFYYKQNLTFVVGDIQTWQMRFIVVYATFLVIASYSIVIWTSVKVLKYLKKMRCHMSTQTRDVHHQMTKALILQAVIPLVFYLFPISIDIILLIFSANIKGFALGINILFSWIPVANSFTTIYVVKLYRKIVIKMIKDLFFRGNATSHSSISYTPSLTTETKGTSK